jgi:hypothetical protein
MKVNLSSFGAGDRILLARGDVWREALTPPSSGSNGNPIVLDAYGSGAAPEITGYQAVSGWVQVAGYTNQWKAPVTTLSLNYVLFGTIWGTKQTSQGALAHERDFFLYNNWLYVYSHSWSHNYYDGPTMLTIRYTGTGPAATMSISGNVLSTTVTGGPGGENLNLDLTNASYSDYTKLVGVIYGRPGYTAALVGLPHGHSVTLANVAGVDIKSATYSVQIDPTKFVPDEMATSAAWLLANISGMSSSEMVYVYPAGKENYQTQLYAAAAGYKGGRGSLSMGQAVAGTFGANSGQAAMESNVRGVYGYGVNLQNITSLSVSGFGGQTAAQIAAQVASLVNKAKAWGVPYGFFTHPPETGAPELTTTEVGAVLDGLIAAGASVMTNTQLVDFLASQPPVVGTTFYVAEGSSAAVDLRETARSATVLQGSNQGAAYRVDMAGAIRPLTGAWDIGAYQTLWTKQGGGSGGGHFTMGGTGGVAGENAYCSAGETAGFGSADGPATLPQQCVYTAMAGSPSPGTVTTVAADCSNLQSVLNAALAGDTIVIPAAATCTGTYTFPAKSGADRSHWITVRSSAISDPNFPAEGMQATPCNINLMHIDGYPDYPCSLPAVRMPTISSGTVNTSPVTIDGNFYRLIGLNITKNYGTAIANQLVDMTGTDHVILDRCLIHGDNWDLHTPRWDTHVGVVTRGTYQAILNSWIYDIDWNAADGYAIGGGTGSQADEGPIKLYNNLIAGGSESWIFGGGFAASWPHDYEIRRNLSMKPLKWFLAFDANSFSVSVNVKNLGEYKHGRRVLYEDNVFMNNWEGQADQFGYALVILPKNQASTNVLKYVNTNGTAVSCASDAAGTPCAAHTGEWGNQILSMSRSNGIVTLNGGTNGDWPNYNVGGHVVLQGIPSQVVNGVNLNTFNGEWTMGCLNATTCTEGFSTPNVLYFSAAGPDFPLTTLTTPNNAIAQDYTASTCAVANHCHFAAPKGNYSGIRIASVVDSEHITTMEDLGVQTGVTQQTCHPGLAPNAQVQDFTARYNYIAHSENVGFNIGNVSGPCLDQTRGISRLSIHDNLADDIQTVAWIQGPASGHGGTGPIITNTYFDPSLTPHDISITHNTWAGLRGYSSIYFSSGGVEISDNFNTVYTGLTVQRIANVVTITFNALSGVPQYQYVTSAGFTGSYADLNGMQTVTGCLTTSVTFTEAGSHADINPAVTIAAGTTGAGTVALAPLSYYANASIRDNIFAGPVRVTNHASTLLSGIAAGFALNLCQGGACSWTYKNNIVATNPYPGYPQPGAAYLNSYPTANPDASPACTVASGCSVADLSGVFRRWGNGQGDTRANDYTVTTNYRGAGSDGKDVGADIQHINAVKAAVLPPFTYNPLTIATTSLTPCTNGVYCEQQLLISNGASGATGFVMWHVLSGTLPTGMNFTTFDNSSAGDCKVNGAWKTGPTGCPGFLWGTPTQSGSFPLTFQAEDAAHQTKNVSLTLLVN